MQNEAGYVVRHAEEAANFFWSCGSWHVPDGVDFLLVRRNAVLAEHEPVELDGVSVVLAFLLVQCQTFLSDAV